MSRGFSSQCDFKNPKDSTTFYAPGRIFDVTKIPRYGSAILKDPPLKVARLLIQRGLSALHNENSTRLPNIPLKECCTLKNLIYIIFDDKRYSVIYVGQTIQKLEKRISDHIRNMKHLQRFGSFDDKSHKSLITYKMAVNGIHGIHVLPWFCFEKSIKPT